jgi:hypothetical protein
VSLYTELIALDPVHYRDALGRAVDNLIIDLRDLGRTEQEVADEPPPDRPDSPRIRLRHGHDLVCRLSGGSCTDVVPLPGGGLPVSTGVAWRWPNRQRRGVRTVDPVTRVEPNLQVTAVDPATLRRLYDVVEDWSLVQLGAMFGVGTKTVRRPSETMAGASGPH